jgi:hypothetical protein
MDKLARVLFHVYPVNPDTFETMRVLYFNPPVSGQGKLVLRNLITFGKIRVKVVLPRELSERRYGTVGSKSHPDREFNDASVEHWKHAWHPKAHGAGMRVGAGAKDCRTPAKNLACGLKLSVNF